MNSTSQRVELIANVTIIVAAVLIVGFLARQHFARSRTSGQPVIGSKMNLPGIRWANRSRSVILALQTDCRFCTESAPFYKRIAERVRGTDTQLIAAFPTGVEESAAHLKELGITGFEVRQLPLDVLQTSGTPTLILTDDKGEITGYWLGKLTPAREAEVLEKLNSQS